ncbi:putative cytidine deaminase protein [Zalerion maritima]|uniref:Peroxisomal trans-2-enoyl-CoA reductase n=1 Tax=Zalerion maritima TaxID=339359 RepID=A0AAD5WLZ6_9PEZI|nr:putative cytidine deaminase protein [Zalerion maritima]
MSSQECVKQKWKEWLTDFGGRRSDSMVSSASFQALRTCDKTASSESYRPLVESINNEFPNTRVIPFPFNVGQEDETLVLIDEVLNAFGRLDVWVCSSGLLGPPSIQDTTPADLQRCLEAHSVAPFFALKHAPAAMGKLTEKKSYPNAAPKTQKYGSIIVIGSVASTYGGCWGPAYTMTAHAALGVVRSGVAVLKGTGVRINCISPGQIDVGVDLKGTDMRGMTLQFPPASLQTQQMQETSIGLERAGRPQEVARVAGFLASGFSSYISGSNLVVDGGLSRLGNSPNHRRLIIHLCVHTTTPSMTSQHPLSGAAGSSQVEQTCKDYGLLPAEFRELQERAKAAKSTAYCPYSQFRVGATILTAAGEFVDGANVENASYPVGTCAERVAFGKAVTEGKKEFKAVAVSTDIAPPASPCGMCRQL